MAEVSKADFRRRTRPNRLIAGDVRLLRLKRRVARKSIHGIGPKRSGKDTIRHTLQSLISPKAVCGPTLDSMGTNFGMSAFIGKQLAIVGDMRLGSKCDKDLLAENILKLSGRGLFTIDRKHKDHWTGPLPCKLLLISNEMPKIKDTSGALASRIDHFSNARLILWARGPSPIPGQDQTRTSRNFELVA